MKTIKIIELLNKIANGEDVPYSVKISESGSRHTIYNLKKESGRAMFVANVCEGNLNKEVEIIEDNKIEKIDVRYGLKEEDVGFENETYLLAVVGEQATKINEIIDYINNNDNHIPRID